jgi:hypothetical protein
VLKVLPERYLALNKAEFSQEQMPKKKNVHNKERYDQNKEEMSKYRHERYRTIHKKDLNIKVSTGTFTLYFD